MNATKSSGDFADELKIIPWWAYFLGSIAFLCIQLIFHVVVPHHAHNPPPEGVRYVLALVAGLAVGVYFMLLGYVNVDAGRRGMSRALWTFIVIFVPNGIGYLIYFLMRKPLQTGCPNCSATIATGAAYCPKCGHRLKPVCPACDAPLQPGDAFCASCGKPIPPSAVQKT